MTAFTPKPEDKFTFGLWTVGNRGRDPFGSEVRESKTPAELVYLLSEVGAYGVNFHAGEHHIRMPRGCVRIWPGYLHPLARATGRS